MHDQAELHIVTEISLEKMKRSNSPSGPMFVVC